ncbi:hypothetical protein O6H91_11G074000 [Diphasiastrum complanatum]|uniref:Uncharacterized protein n=1 Tax=Diphasiastrum complanatum TaxID=34168 RepID=A0ACC2CAR2_DIPCM|nr:hypothetical protein O6H91_11G074000 [Diphasiastrum complanatum]
MDVMNHGINPKSQGKTLIAMMGLLSLLLFTTIIWKILHLRLQSLPPGPRGWPVVGNLFQFKRFFTSGLQDLVKIYGPILTLYVGSTPFIIITDAQIAHEALVAKGSIFASRPSPRSYSRNYVTISSGVYGPVWRALRKNLVSGMISSSRASNFRYVMEECVQDLVTRFREKAARNGGIVDARPVIRYGIFNLLLSLCFGKHAEESVVLEVAQILKKSLFRARKQLDAAIPWLRFIPWINTKSKEAQALRQQQVNIILPLIKEAQRLREEGKLPSGSYIYSLLAINDLQGEKLSDDLLVTLCSEVLNAGTESTASALEWAIANIIIQPKIQTAIVQEIERVVGNRAITEEDIHKLPYLEAVVKETLRRHPPGYCTLPHAVTQPCKLRGYDIPLNARVFVNSSSISNDPSLWADPTEFKPERFLDLDLDITGSKKITMIPFGAGRRICPGLGLAMLHLNCILARLMQSFEWSTSAPGDMVDLTETHEFTMVMRTPLRVLIEPR